MKLAVLADVHANWPALQAVAEDIERWQPDQVVVAGDLINRGPRPVECLEFALKMQRERAWRLVLGNHEEYVIHHAHPREPIAGPWAQIWGSSCWTYEKLGCDVSALEAMPLQQSWHMPDGSEVRVVHASMRGTRDGIFRATPDDVLRQQIAPAPRLFVVGHTHQPLARMIDQTLVVNVGAVGLPFDLDPRACYAQLMWQGDRWEAEIIRVEYDRAQADRDFDESGFIEEAGPIALLIRDELAQARSNLFEWTRDYEAAVIAGQMTMAESVTRFLAA
ncbi:MAG TPA: metallophosphoesterase family protein [Anaerolineae bacterium]|nr:metallophosphoesterase family protein [Anaerolineae bacterium]